MRNIVLRLSDKRKSKKPMQLENSSAFGGSSTSGTLTSTDSNRSNRDVPSGTLTSTDSNNSFRKSRGRSVHSGHHDGFGLSTRGQDQSGYPERQSGSHSSHSLDSRQITVLERLTKTHPIWYLPECGRTGAVHLLKDKEIGIFLVRKSSREEVMALSVQFPSPEGVPNVDHYLIEPMEEGFHLQGSYHGFKAIPELIAYYCDHKEDLPHSLVLPPAVRKARTLQELSALAMLGQDFWTSSMYEGSSRGNSRASSRSNLSDHSFNKSSSEPINIASKSTIPPYSQSDTAIANSPPKHSIIDFSSYLIQKQEQTGPVRTPTRTGSTKSAKESVHSRSSVGEITQNNGVMTSSCGHMNSNHMVSAFRCNGAVAHTESFVHNIERTIDLQDSTPVLNPSQKMSPKGKSNLYFTTPLELLNMPPEECYFTSNLSDKLSDYEDIWKTSAPPSVQADIQARLRPNIISAKSPSGGRVSDAETESHDSDSKFVFLASDTQFDSSCVHDGTDSEDNDREDGNSVVSGEVCVDSGAVVQTSIVALKSPGQGENGCVLALDSSLHNNLNCEFCEDKSFHMEDPQKMSGFEPIPEQESDLDTDSCHSDSCHSADADTEEGEVKSLSVQTQTSPVVKNKPCPLPALPKKSASTSSLAAMKSPVYSEPFDAINSLNVDQNQLSEMPKLPKKLRRRSAPAVWLYRKKQGSVQYPKFSAIPSEEVGDFEQTSTGQTDLDLLVEEDSVIQDRVSSETVIDGVSAAAAAAAEAENESPAKTPKPPVTPRKKKQASPVETSESPCETVSSRKVIHEVANRKEKEKQKNVQNDLCVPTVVVNPLTNNSHSVVDQLQFMEEFEPSKFVPSSPTLNKFPLYVKHGEVTKRLSYTENSTVEDIITTWNPELRIRPLLPFPLVEGHGPMSEYDNLGRGTEYIAPSRQSAYSMGTIFCKPWDSSVWGKIISSSSPPPNTPPPPPLPPPLDPHERIRAWQESSQNFQNVTTDTEEDRTRSCVSDAGSGDTRSFQVDDRRQNVSRSRPTSQSDKTLVNENVSHSRAGKFSEENGQGPEDIPLFGADFREKVRPILAYPRLLNQTRNRNPDTHIREYIIRLSNDSNTTFGCTIANFIQCTLESQDTNPFNVTRNVRQFMNGIKNYLVKHGEGELEDLIERERNKLQADEILNIDAIIESALHECVLHPLKQNLYRLFVNEYTKNGNLPLLSNNIKYARTKAPEEIGIRRDLTPPSGQMLEQIKQYFVKMQKSYSPLKKLENLLGATSSIYKCVTSKAGNENLNFGADDFLPMLIYVLIQCGMVSVEIEADYMWGLLHPSLLTGEGGYYLTSLSSAVLVLKNFREMQETTTSSKKQGKLPSISDMQGFLKLAIPDELRDTIVWKTLPVRPNMTTKDVCSMIAHKFKVTNPQDYGLYALENREERKLSDNECPQVLKAECYAVTRECVFAYKRNEANIAWPKSLKGF